MTPWLQTIQHALDARTSPLDLFVRDDDAGWEDARLAQLLDIFERAGMAIDLAVIPTACGTALSAALRQRRLRGMRVGFHQHGFAHTNHEAAGRHCEFGRSRLKAEQRRDVETGQRLLRAEFGALLDDIFTPPWNRCTSATAASLAECGIRVLSRDATAEPLALPDGVVECPIHVDWFAKAKGVRLTRGAWAALLARRITGTSRPLGLMLHHAVMNADEFAACQALIQTLGRHPQVRSIAMRAAAH